ncbi:MAG TPA: hypothetical protein VHN99_07090, partial [Deinococcales bacterium]|nr:hypothetical protein [Deinococcales bacterium]
LARIVAGPEDAAAGPVFLLSMPEPGVLKAFLAANADLRFAFTDRTLGALEDTRFWTLAALKDSRDRPGLPPRAEQLLRAAGPSLDATPAEAYAACPDLLAEEREAYRLRQFCLMYRHADETGFARAVGQLYAPAAPEN